MKYKHLRPFKLRFMGRTYEVEYKSELPDNNYGTTYHQHHRVEILDNQPPLEEADTLVHELMHILWYHMGLCADLEDDLEERVVRSMATALTNAMAENPMLLEYLKASLKKET